MFHGQLPLPMPCYDFVHITGLTVAEHSAYEFFHILSARFRVFPAPLT